MNRIATQLYPMQVTPKDFKIGDVVKKTISVDSESTFVGVVTAIIPSTNKVEVQWPQNSALEDPWDLIKVNPLINPPTVKEDSSYDSYQTHEQKAKEHTKKLQHYTVLNEFLQEHLKPALKKAAELYNKGFSKGEAFKYLKAYSDESDVVKVALDKIFSDNVHLVKNMQIIYDGKDVKTTISLMGNSDSGILSVGITKNIEVKVALI